MSMETYIRNPLGMKALRVRRVVGEGDMLVAEVERCAHRKLLRGRREREAA